MRRDTDRLQRMEGCAGPQHGGRGEGGEGLQAAGNIWINSADERRKKERVRLFRSSEAMRCGRVALLLLE